MQLETETMTTETKETSVSDNVTEDVTDLEITPGLEGLNTSDKTWLNRVKP